MGVSFLVFQSQGNGGVVVNSSNLQLATQEGVGSPIVGLKFNNVQVPKGATVLSAAIEFVLTGTSSGAVVLDIWGDASAE